MEGAGLAFSAIDRFAVTLGPGTFTGVRVGVAAARAFALAPASLSSARPASPSWPIAPMCCSGASAPAGRWPSPSMRAAAWSTFRSSRITRLATGDALLATPEQAASAHRAAAGARRRLGRSRGRSRGGRPCRGFACPTCNRMHGRLPSWRRILRRSTASRRSICGSPMPSRRPTKPCRGCRHDEPGTARARRASCGPERSTPKNWHGCTLRFFLRHGTLPAFKALLDHPGSTAFMARAGEPPETRRLHRRAGLPRTKRKSSRSACARAGSGRASGGGWSKPSAGRPRRRRRAGCILKLPPATRRRSGSTRSWALQEIGRRKGYYERPGAPPEDAINLSLAL